MNIVIQGIQGSFHHTAAIEYFGENFTLNECMSFAEMPELVVKNIAEHAVMAIENSIAGAILPNYQLIDSNNLFINGEIFLPMIHNFMALEGQRISDIKEVWSHPMAIQHCQRFFRDNPHLRIVEERDTASVAKMIKEQELRGVAAIASKRASEIYGLEILQEEIQTDMLNMMRYFVLSKQRNHHPEDYLNDKASLKFVTKIQTGTLAEILAIFTQHNIDLCKIQSMPITKEPWNYAFFIDINFKDYHEYCQALILLESKVKELKILGEYPENKPVFN